MTGTYDLGQVNKRRENMGLPILTSSAYHCVKCGRFNNPFTCGVAEQRELLIKNICKHCKVSSSSSLPYKDSDFFKKQDETKEL